MVFIRNKNKCCFGKPLLSGLGKNLLEVTRAVCDNTPYDSDGSGGEKTLRNYPDAMMLPDTTLSSRRHSVKCAIQGGCSEANN